MNKKLIKRQLEKKFLSYLWEKLNKNIWENLKASYLWKLRENFGVDLKKA